MYAVASMPCTSRTRATLRRAEFGFFGVEVYTRVQTPRFCGQFLRAGAVVLRLTLRRPLRTSWLIVGMNSRCGGRSRLLESRHFMDARRGVKHELRGSP